MARRDKFVEAQEALIDRYLESIGIKPIRNPNEAEGSGDRIIEGERVAYKTLSGIQNPNSDTLSGAKSNRAMNARTQSPNVVIDARGQVGMTEADAIRGVTRAYTADKMTALKSGILPKLQSIRVIFMDGSANATDILIRRHQ